MDISHLNNCFPDKKEIILVLQSTRILEKLTKVGFLKNFLWVFYPRIFSSKYSLQGQCGVLLGW